jgi:hypothetical protein
LTSVDRALPFLNYINREQKATKLPVYQYREAFQINRDFFFPWLAATIFIYDCGNGLCSAHNTGANWLGTVNDYI